MDTMHISKAIVIYYNPKAYEITESYYFEPARLSLNFEGFSLECPLKSAIMYFDVVKYIQGVEEYLHYPHFLLVWAEICDILVEVLV